jgi:hypothetical protein
MFAVQGVLPQASLLLPMEGSNRAANHAACGMGRDNDLSGRTTTMMAGGEESKAA